LLRTRIVTALLLGSAITAVILWLPTWAVAAIVGVFWLGGAWEWAGLARWHGALRLAYLVGVLSLMLLLMWPGFGDGAAAWVIAVAALWWALALIWIQTYPRSIPSVLVAAAGPLSLVPAWFVLVWLHGTYALGPALALSVLVIIWAADVGAYLVGRSIGRVKLAPSVSPGKTWEGVIGGMLLATLASAAAALLLGFPLGTFVAIGLAAAMVSVVGDLTVSMFKRNAGFKDSGRLLPGHGGILDRIDSLAAAIPIFALGLTVAGIRS